METPAWMLIIMLLMVALMTFVVTLSITLFHTNSACMDYIEENMVLMCENLNPMYIEKECGTKISKNINYSEFLYNHAEDKEG